MNAKVALFREKANEMTVLFLLHSSKQALSNGTTTGGIYSFLQHCRLPINLIVLLC